MKLDRSAKLLERARRRIPGGVNSPVRAFGAVGGTPPFIAAARGARLYDVDGNEYVDYVGSWGPMVVGHAHPRVVEAIRRAAERGTSFGAPTEGEVEMAELLARLVPSLEKVRMVSSGTEAGLGTIRLARGFTGRDKILKFEGCYHGHADSLLVQAGSGGATFGVPNSLGVPADFARHTLTAPYNDLGAVRALFDAEGERIAAVIVEPVAGNMGLVLPEPGFLEGLREITRAHGALLIFDEVMTGFRVALGGAQARYGIAPDLTMLGKVVGGGLPVGAFGGRAQIMDALSPEGGVYQAGTLSGNPLAVAAGLATLRLLAEPGAVEALEKITADLAAGLADAARRAGVALSVAHVGSMFGFFFRAGPVRNFAEAARSDTGAFARFHAAMLAGGVYLAPSQFEAGFVSTAHGPADLARTLEAARAAFAAL